jgi:hypothetical protein
MDELQLIRQFRADLPVAAGARGRAQEALRARITGRRRRRKLVLAAAFAVVALLATGVALGLADDVIDLVRGKPAPKDVKTLSFRTLDLPPGARWTWPQADASRAKGVAAVRVEDGLFGLWEAPVEGGGWCFATWVVDEEVSRLLAPGGIGACDFKPLPRGRMLAFPGNGFTAFFTVPHGRRWIGSIFGVTPTEVTDVRVRFPSGRTIQTKTLPSFYSKVRYFLVAVPRGADDLEAEGLDGKGRVVARTPEGTDLSFN